MNISLSNLTAQNTPQWLHNIGLACVFGITVTGSIVTACVTNAQSFGAATPKVLLYSAISGIVLTAIKLGIMAIGGNVNPNNITPETASATVDTTKPTTPVPTAKP